MRSNAIFQQQLEELTRLIKVLFESIFHVHHFLPCGLWNSYGRSPACGRIPNQVKSSDSGAFEHQVRNCVAIHLIEGLPRPVVPGYYTKIIPIPPLSYPTHTTWTSLSFGIINSSASNVTYKQKKRVCDQFGIATNYEDLFEYMPSSVVSQL